MSANQAILFDIINAVAALVALLLAMRLATRQGMMRPAYRAAGLAFATSGIGAGLFAVLGPQHFASGAVLSIGYLAWLWTLHRLFASDERDKNIRPIRPVVFSLIFVEAMQMALLGASLQAFGVEQAQEALGGFATLFRLLFCVGALVLVHNLYAGAGQQARATLRWPAAALATIWLYDLNLYTIAYIIGSPPILLSGMRGAALVVAAIFFALGLHSGQRDLRLRPSRGFAFQSFSLVLIGAYLAAMMLLARGAALLGGEFAAWMQGGLVLVAALVALAVLPSKRLRGWLRVTISKHLFQHRYDYRAEWLRFTDTIGRAGPQAAPLHERAVQAVADITDSPGGLLLSPHEEGGLALDARWQWPGIEVPALAMNGDGARFFEQSQFILDLDDMRGERVEGIPESAHPAWLQEDEAAWALVPLLHYERLIGIVVLARPVVGRRLDGEDFDLLRIVGRQLASYLAEQSSQNALGEAQRFDEFNRRMAFVMHDIKNLASQLSLLAGNAEKHADNPEFRKDMLLTLRNSTDKLQTLLSRLGRYGAQGIGELSEVSLDTLVGKVIAQYEGRHPVVGIDRAPCRVMANAEALEQALVHLVQNALDASEPQSPVFVDLRTDTNTASIEIIDSGTGMSPEFIRTRLFRPFHSSKQGGFGIGAYEAREMIRSMGGRLDVESREGEGTRFQLRFPLAQTESLYRALHDRPALPGQKNNKVA